MKKINRYILYFLSFSFIGYSWEVILQFIRHHKFIHCGTLLGPWLPIYGWGGILLHFLLNPFKKYPLLILAFTIIICSILEYFASYFMEKIFHARWWDYSNKKFNLNGRICINTMIPFAICGLIMIYVLNPLYFNLISHIITTIINIITIILIIMYTIDNIITFYIFFKLRKKFNMGNKDATEQINKEVLNHIKNKSHFKQE